MSLPDGPFIFVSYARTDAYFVHPEIERLEKQGHRIWYDKEKLQPGTFWDDAIREAIDTCACFIVFITADSINSINVLKEIVRALSAKNAKKSFISIHWEKVNIPDDFQKQIRNRGLEIPDDLREQLRSRQALERYSLLKHEYEGPLSRALAPYTQPGFEPPALPPPPARPDTLPKIVFFMLALLAAIFVLLAAILVVTPYFASTLPGDPLNNRLVGWLSGILFVVIACGMGGAAFAVHRIYLRGKHG